ncbi:MAG: hypothetical protein PHV36_06825 [Elusimicrobiales bacterium]|nr:hypothetical protein [Elusimicrobiales bacterium]
MLKEAKNVSQSAGEPRRRWFDDEYFDLIVWFEKDDSIFGFQLCYDREYKPRALTWTKKDGYKHTGIDDGEGGGILKESPVLVVDGLFDSGAIGKKLEAAAKELPPQISLFVLKKVSDFKL